MKKNLLALLLALALVFALAACGASDATPAESSDNAGTAAETDSETTEDPIVLKVAASPSPHAEILEQAKPILAEQGIDLQITEYTDYIMPNIAVDEGDMDANYFQHQPYLDQFNVDNDTQLVSVGAVHYEPFAIYPCNCTDLSQLPDGAKVGVPNDVTNEARALLLLQSNGLITLAEGAGLNATTLDIVDNPKDLDIIELEAAMLPNMVDDLDIACINGNYAIPAGFSSTDDALAVEAADSEAAQTYANVLVVKEGNENNEAIQALYAALTSDTIRDYINETYSGNVLPIF